MSIVFNYNFTILFGKPHSGRHCPKTLTAFGLDIIDCVMLFSSHVVGPRHPFRKEPDLDYDVDSDEEWEEVLSKIFFSSQNWHLT